MLSNSGKLFFASVASHVAGTVISEIGQAMSRKEQTELDRQIEMKKKLARLEEQQRLQEERAEQQEANKAKEAAVKAEQDKIQYSEHTKMSFEKATGMKWPEKNQKIETVQKVVDTSEVDQDLADLISLFRNKSNYNK